MGRLEWDPVSKKLYETGTDRGVLYPCNAAGEYPKGVAWHGLTGVSESPSGAEPTPLYANNHKYLDLRSAETYGGNIKAYTYPDEWAACDGSAEIAPGITIGQQTRQMFGLSYRTLIGNDIEGDAYGYKLHLVYGATASPSSEDHETVNADPSAIEFDWEFSTNPVDVPGFKKPTATLEFDSTKVPEEFLKAIEDILYGTDAVEADVEQGIEAAAATDPRLPLPSEVIELYNEFVNDEEEGE